MRADRVVVTPPTFDNNMCLLRFIEYLAIEQFVSKRPSINPTAHWRRFTLRYRHFNLAKQDHNLLRIEPLLRHNQSGPLLSLFPQRSVQKAG
jgi:hypothetical protein